MFLCIVSSRTFEHTHAHIRTSTLKRSLTWLTMNILGLQAALHHKFRRENAGEDVVPRLVHRLDVETSGLLVLALDKKVAGRLGTLLQERQVSGGGSALGSSWLLLLVSALFLSS